MPPRPLKITNGLLFTKGKGTSQGALCDLDCRPDGSWSAAPAAPHSVAAANPGGPFNSITELYEGLNGHVLDAKGSVVLLGGLVHPHIHLDKCFLLDRCKLETGTFAEALSATSEAKAQFKEDDLFARGRKLIRDSLSHGVTVMRAHVEVSNPTGQPEPSDDDFPCQIDPIVSLKCLHAGFRLKASFATSCSLQLVAFAQDPFFYPDSPSTENEIAALFDSTVDLHLSSTHGNISAVGSAPYVERSRDAAICNIEKVFSLAKKVGVDVDFHLDYDLDHSTQALLWDVIRIAKAEGNSWDVGGRTRRITLGHCTKLSLFDNAEMDRLAGELKSIPGEIHFVALPPSDIYMQGRSTAYASRSRATFPALDLVKRGISCSIGVNNVGNGFTPQGDADPLALLPMLVGVWQSAQPDALHSLLVGVKLQRRTLPSR
ncbi:cytosine/creatinine deaminase, partial [Phenoliferia sp. Uapishka_3]